jgi:uncharacterized protein
VKALQRLLAAPIIGAIVLYQRFVSPMRPPTCRYYPSCSQYALTAIRRFGPVLGTWLALKRLVRCHPWAPGGVDHVPQTYPRRHGAPPAPAPH